MAGFLLQLCAANRCSSTLFDEYRRLTQLHHRALVARAVVAAAARQRRRRVYCAPATHLHNRRRIIGCHSLSQLVVRRIDMASAQEIRRRHSVADRIPADLIMPSTGAPNSNNNPATPLIPAAVPGLSRVQQEMHPDSTHSRQSSAASTLSMPPPSLTQEDVPVRRGHARAKSSVSRQINRLSLTLPIAPPTRDPSRPTPTSSTMASVPPTPVDSAAASPSDANESIIAIAAQERRVLELREELARAEADLISLKRKWTTQDVAQKRGEQYPGAMRSSPSAADDESAGARRSFDLERRKLLQQSQTATPRRKVLRGGHTRTLSLLSPAKESGFNLHGDRTSPEPVKLPSVERRAAQLTNPSLSKRASWQPRSQQNVPGVPQLVEDFKLGLRAFVEDIRQITVGDEPINGQPLRSTSIDQRNGSSRDPMGNQDTIRPSHPLRPKVSTVFEPPHSAESAQTSSKTDAASKEKPKAKAKHFSWTPLAVDSLDDNDWSNWESPSSSTKTSRWSGSTMGSSLDDVPNDGEQSLAPSKKKSTGFDSPLLSPKLEEILPNMVNRLTPSNIKRTANNLMEEWEKSLTEPQGQQQQVQAQANDRENAV